MMNQHLRETILMCQPMPEPSSSDNPTEDDFIRGDNGPAPEIEFDKDSYSENGKPPEQPFSVDRPTSPPPPKSGDKK